MVNLITVCYKRWSYWTAMLIDMILNWRHSIDTVSFPWMHLNLSCWDITQKYNAIVKYYTEKTWKCWYYSSNCVRFLDQNKFNHCQLWRRYVPLQWYHKRHRWAVFICICIEYLRIVQGWLKYTVFQKKCHLINGSNFVKSQPIFKILSPLEREGNFQ